MDLEPFCGESTNKGERSGRDWDKEGMAGTGGSRTTSLLCPSSQNHIRSATIVESQYKRRIQLQGNCCCGGWVNVAWPACCKLVTTMV